MNSRMRMPLSVRRWKKSLGVPMVPKLSRMRLTCTRCRCLAALERSKRRSYVDEPLYRCS